MLKGIPKILSPELLKVLAEMGHGDVLCIGDGNFPAESMGKNGVVIRADGHGVPEMLDAILQLFPLDDFVEKPVKLMKVVGGENLPEPEIWATFKDTIAKYDDRGADTIETVERFDFYDLSRKSYCVISTGESALYACILLQKGVIRSE